MSFASRQPPFPFRVCQANPALSYCPPSNHRPTSLPPAKKQQAILFHLPLFMCAKIPPTSPPSVSSLSLFRPALFSSQCTLLHAVSPSNPLSPDGCGEFHQVHDKGAPIIRVSDKNQTSDGLIVRRLFRESMCEFNSRPASRDQRPPPPPPLSCLRFPLPPPPPCNGGCRRRRRRRRRAGLLSSLLLFLREICSWFPSPLPSRRLLLLLQFNALSGRQTWNSPKK